MHMLHKGIILTAGAGTRLWPMTHSVNKQMLPIYDKPMIYYPLTQLMKADIRDILIITSPADREVYETLLQDGSQWGVNISFAVQEKLRGIADAFLIGEQFIGRDNITLLLGDNIFHGGNVDVCLKKAFNNTSGATVFAYPVDDPSQYGVIAFNENGKPISIEEKPQYPKSQYAVTGLYYYDNQVIDIAKSLKPSKRGELEITDVNSVYLHEKNLEVELLNQNTTWLDAGTSASLLAAANFIQTTESKQGVKIGCPEETAWRLGFINDEALIRAANRYAKNHYGQYLLKLLAGDIAC
jgi:glucose-1-phosphate thymidylyltransferase